MMIDDLTISAAYPQYQGCVYDLIFTHARINPDTVAITGLEIPSITYGTLAAYMDKTLHLFNEMGIGRNDRVAIVLPNGPEMATAFLSVSSGATCAPLNPAYRAGEFEFYLKDLNAKAVIVQKGAMSPVITVARELGVPIIEMSNVNVETGVSFELKGEVKRLFENGGYAGSKDTALVLHTSGTTSRPKIVPLTHRNLCTSAGNIQRSLALSETDICLNVMPLFHIHGLVGALLSTLAAGGTAVCSPGFEASGFFSWLTEFDPTWYTAVPTMHQAILSRYGSDANKAAPSSLRFIRSCSSPLPPKVFKDLESTFKVPVIESYGMTEAAHQMTSNPLPPGARKIGSVGLPAGPEVSILSETGRMLPSGEVGEIVIRGENVTSGYENNPSANKSGYSDGWFRTGDQGFLDPDGYLFITGRIKEIINRAGEKIAPREIDEVLLEHPAVAQAVTFAVPHKTIGEDVAAAVVVRESATVSQKELRAFAFHRLADFKVPSQIIFVEAIPKGATGKIQRIGLSDKLASELKREFTPPDDQISETVADIWKAVLKTGPIGLHDNFFYLGGDSLLAVQVMSRIREAFLIDLPIGTLFRGPTVDEQARMVEERLIDEVESLSDEEAFRQNK